MAVARRRLDSTRLFPYPEEPQKCLSEGTELMKIEVDPNKRIARKPYQKPAFRRERVFETMALACGKISTTQQQCKSLVKLS
jgi:hypothetical protein